MPTYRSYDAKENKILIPIIFLNQNSSNYREFLSNYDPESGFLIAKRGKGYFLFMGGYQYKVDLFDNYGTKIGLGVINKDGITPKSTIIMSTEAIRITGLPQDYITICKDRTEFKNNSRYSGLSAKIKNLDNLLKSTKPTESKKANPLWQSLAEISEKKREFSSHFLIQWKYEAFSVIRSDKANEGYYCVFKMAPPDDTIETNEKRFNTFRKEHNFFDDDEEKDDSLEALREAYINTFSPGSIIEIPLNRPKDPSGKQPMLYGTLVRLELPGVTHTETGDPIETNDEFYAQNDHFTRPWELIISFKDDSSASTKDIAEKNGVVNERASTDYNHYKSTLDVMADPDKDKNWKAAEQVIVKKEISTFKKAEEPVFTSRNLNENQKDAIRLALNAPDFCLIQGPPGSGKTTIITEMIRNFVSRGQKVLVCSKGNLAVDNVLEKWIKENKERSDGHLCVRLGERFKLEFLEGYTPANVTSRLQEKIHNKTKQERDQLIAQINNRINHFEKNVDILSKPAYVCVIFCELTSILTQLCNHYEEAAASYKFGTGNIPNKLESGQKALSVVYHELMLPTYKSLCSTDALRPEQIIRFDGFFNQFLGLLDATLQELHLAWFWRLLSGKRINLWKELEEQLESKRKLLTNIGITGKDFAGNPFINEKTLQLPEFGNTPSPTHVLSAVTNFRTALLEFTKNERIKLSRIKSILNDWLVELGSGVSEPLEKNVVLDCIPVIGSTCMGIMSDSDFKSITYDAVIVDEAGQIPIFDILVPIIKAKKVILIGDHLQLPPMDENDFATYYAAQKTDSKEGKLFDECKKEIAQWYNVSLFETLYNAPTLDAAKTMLNTQYRMHPDISEFISESFYDGKYLAGVTSEQRTLTIAGFEKPIYFYDTCALSPEKRAETNHNPGYSNKTEAELLSDILLKLILAIRDGCYTGANLVLKDNEGNVTGYDIGVISGYKKQVKEIFNLTRQKLEQFMSYDEAMTHMDRFMISSVDSFQGRDNQIILFSMTRSNPDGKIGFLKDVRRLNVAMTRAKSLLIMVGDSGTLTACGARCAHDSSKPVAQIYKNLVNYCKDKNYYHQLKGEEVLES